MITINIEKAKQIAHEIRRWNRTEEFKPFDEAISKQIPGEMEGAEEQRASIREKYATIQTQIDASTTPEEIKTALGM